MRIRISARKSDLARLQAYAVGQALEKQKSNIQIEYRFRESLGDQNQEDPLWKMPAKGVFTEDFKKDLLEGETDLVVHSWKDLPTELGSQTKIVATLKREDSHDLLLFKKSSVLKKKLQIFSSSPRRSWNLSQLLQELLPGSVETVGFANVRGNIQTRVRKLLEKTDIDGLIVAKAALDRLLGFSHPELVATQKFLREALRSLNWMVLPLSENPCAAAQGALAVEIRSDRQDLQELLSSINCEKTFREAQTERKILQQFGGGCHLALGMSHKIFSDYEITYVRGQTPDGERVEKKILLMRDKPSFPKFKKEEYWSSGSLQKVRRNREVELDSRLGYVVSRFEGWAAQSVDLAPPVWAAGLETWKKLARADVWVLGCYDSLGSDVDPSVDALLPGQQWRVLTHDQHPKMNSRRHICTYELSVSGLPPQSVRSIFWRSSSDFLYVSRLRPEILNHYHACGPGSTYEFLKDKIQKDHLQIFLNEEDWRHTQ